MSRFLSPCWRLVLQHNNAFLGNYQTYKMSRLPYSCWQSSNHFRIAVSPLIHRCASGARFFPLDFGETSSSGAAEEVHVQQDATSVSSEGPTIYPRNQPTYFTSPNVTQYNCPTSQDTPNTNYDENAVLLSEDNQTFINRESLAVQEDEAMFLDDFNENLPDIKPINQPESYWASLHALEKDLFNPTAQLYTRSTEESVNYIRRHSITVTGDHNLPPLIQSFQDYNFPEAFAKLLQEQFEAPTPVQAVGWSATLKGYDIVGVGQSGSGKTLGYLVPTLLHVSHHMKTLKEQRDEDQPHSPLGLVLAPTRELVEQIVKVGQQYGPSLGVYIASLIGGSSRDMQVNYMRRRNTMLLVSTPSRILELIQDGRLSLDLCGIVVLDEADRMMHSTMEPQIRAVLAHTRPGRQTTLWSATWPESVCRLSSDLLSDPVYLTVGSTTMLPSSTVTQHVQVIELHDRRDKLREVLRKHFEQNPNGKALVFADTVDDVERLKLSLRRCSAKFMVESLQGNMLQRTRKMILDGFRHGYFSVLIASDLASRGLDIPGLSCVVNFDFPKDISTYIHRVGRTGRHGQPGVCYTFFCQRDTPKAKKLVEVLTMSGQKVDGKLRYLALKQDLPASMTEKFIPFVPLKDRFGNRLIQTESRLASGMKEKWCTVSGSVKDQAFILRNNAKRETLVAHLKTKPHATRHCVEPLLKPKRSSLSLLWAVTCPRRLAFRQSEGPKPRLVLT